MTDASEISRRLRAVEQLQASQEARIAANERGIGLIRNEIIDLRQERRQDADKQNGKLDAIYGTVNTLASDVALSKGARRAIMWVVTAATAVAGALVSVWRFLGGGQ